MGKIQVQFLGSGDAFGSGGRLQTCILVKATQSQFLVDCGASSLIAMRRFGVDPNAIHMILLTHLHGDHFGGIPFFVLDAQFISKRTKALLIAGPAGTKKRVAEAMEVMFPGSSVAQQKFPIEFIELELERPHELGEITVTPYLVEHPSGAPPLALRIACDGRIITYLGDTEWTDTLIPAAKGADLLIAESYFFEKKVKFHLDFQTLIAHLDDLRPKRLIVTHMSQDMLGRLDTLTCEYAEDGKVVEI
jgi:ribonuclease BN (tRNA processing enzyme)